MMDIRRARNTYSFWLAAARNVAPEIVRSLHGCSDGLEAPRPKVWEGEVGCLFDEIQNLVGPTERRTIDSPQGRSEAG